MGVQGLGVAPETNHNLLFQGRVLFWGVGRMVLNPQQKTALFSATQTESAAI